MSKRFLVFAYLLVGTYSAFAQQFGANNPIWNYNETSGWGGNQLHAQLTISKDTIFEGKTCKVLTSGKTTYEGYLPYKNMLCQDSTQVVFWSRVKNDFQILYDFEADKGASWDFWLDEMFGIPIQADSIHVVIDSVYVSRINSIDLNTQIVSYTSDIRGKELVIGTYKIIEGIGNTTVLIPVKSWLADGDYVDGLRCFEDDSIGFYQFDNSVDCDYTETGVVEEINAKSVSVYPNPSQGVFQLKGLTNTEIKRVAVFDINGARIYTNELVTSNNAETYLLDLSNFPEGLYVFEVTSNGGQVIREKLILQGN